MNIFESIFIAQNHYLANEYFTILDGFIHSFIVIGIIIFFIGFYERHIKK